MDFEKEISLLKFQVKLMSHAINWKDNLWLRFVVNNGIDEQQAETITLILAVLRFRLEEGDPKTIYDESEWDPNEFGLSVETLFQNQPPTYKEFAGYCTAIFGNDIEPLLVLSYKKQQPLHAHICAYLLEDAEDES